MKGIDVSGNALSRSGIEAITRALPSLPALQAVDLQDNAPLSRADLSVLPSPAIQRPCFDRVEGGRNTLYPLRSTQNTLILTAGVP